MTQKARHAARGMMLGQPISCENIRKPRIAWRSKTVLCAREPIDRWVRVARIKQIAHRRFKRLVMRRERTVLQTSRHINPAESVLMQNEGRVARNRV